MSRRDLFLIGYDISCCRRRKKALQAVRLSAVGGQKSFYECWLSPGEFQQALASLRSIVDLSVDRVVLIQLDGRTQSITLGAAQPIDQGTFFHVS